MAENIVGHLSDKAFGIFYEYFTRDGQPIEDAKGYSKVKAKLLETFAPRKTTDHIITEAVQLNYDGSDITAFVQRLRSLIRTLVLKSPPCAVSSRKQSK